MLKFLLRSDGIVIFYCSTKAIMNVRHFMVIEIEGFWTTKIFKVFLVCDIVILVGAWYIITGISVDRLQLLLLVKILSLIHI